MKSITRADAKELADEIELALKPVAERHGLAVEVGGGTFGPTSFKPRIEFKTNDADERTFEQYARFWGLEGQYGKTFEFAGDTFRISGVAPRSTKRPILATNVENGKTFKFTPDAVKNALSVTV